MDTCTVHCATWLLAHRLVEKKLSCLDSHVHLGAVDGISNVEMGRRKPRRTSQGSAAKVPSDAGEVEGGDGAEEGAEEGSNEELETLHRRVQELEAANADLKGEAEDAMYWKAALHQIQDEHMELRKQLEQVREKKRYPGNGEETFRVRMEKAERALERERDMVKSLQRKIGAMEEQFRYVDATKERSSSNEERIRMLEDELEGAMTKLKQEQENNASLGLQIMDMESQRTVSGIDAQGISRELERLRQEYAEVQAMAETAKMAKAEAEDAWTRTKEELIVLQEERESLTAKLNSVQGTMEKLLQLNDELTEQVNRKQCDIDELVNHLAQISQDSVELGVEEGTTTSAFEEEDVTGPHTEQQDREVAQATTPNEEHEPGTLDSDGNAESTTPGENPNAGEETEPFLTVPVAEMPPDRFVMDREGDAKIQPGSSRQKKSGIWNYITGADRVDVDLNK